MLVLDRELHILHVSVMIFQSLGDGNELIVNLRHHVLELIDLVRSTDAGDNVFALCVQEELTHQMLLARSRISGKGNTGSGGLAHVSECHHLNIDRGTPGIRDIIVTAVDVCTRVIPGTEDSLDRFDQLLLRIIREISAELGLVFILKLVGKGLQIIGIQLDILGDAFFRLHLIDELFEILLADFHDNVREHLDESAIAVPCPARIAALFGENVDNIFVQAEVQDGIHHTRHRCACTGTDRNKKRILTVTELLAGDLFHLVDTAADLLHDLVIDAASVFIILGACFRCDRETLRDRKSESCHLGKACAFSAKQVSHARIALCEHVNILCCHLHSSCKCAVVVRITVTDSLTHLLYRFATRLSRYESLQKPLLFQSSAAVFPGCCSNHPG